MRGKGHDILPTMLSLSLLIPPRFRGPFAETKKQAEIYIRFSPVKKKTGVCGQRPYDLQVLLAASFLWEIEPGTQWLQSLGPLGRVSGTDGKGSFEAIKMIEAAGAWGLSTRDPVVFWTRANAGDSEIMDM